MKFTLISTFLVSLTACGSLPQNASNDTQNKNPTVASGENDLLELQSQHIASSKIKSFYVADSVSNFKIMTIFYPNNRYLIATVRQLDVNTYQAMANIGTYALSGEKIEISPKYTSCPSFPKKQPTLSGADESGTILVSNGSSTATLMKKNLDEFSKDGFEMHWGCFEQYTGTPSTHEWIKL